MEKAGGIKLRKDFTTDGADGSDGANTECSPRKTWQGMQNEEFLSVKSVKSAVKFLWFRRAALPCNMSESLRFAKILPQMGTDGHRWNGPFVLCLSARICGSVLWLRRATPCLLRLLAPIQYKLLPMNNLRSKRRFPNQGQSRLVKVN